MSPRHAAPRGSRILLTLVATVLAWPAGLGAQAAAVFPGEDWAYVRGAQVADYGWDREALARLDDFLVDSANTTGLFVVDRGRVVFSFGDTDEVSYLASVRKSILAMLYGFWVERGIIDLDATLEELGMDDVGGLLPIEKRATVGHLITARSGVYHEASNSGDDLARAPERGSQEPGTYMLYSNWDFNAAGYAFELMTGRDIYDEIQGQLATPMQFQDWDRSLHAKSGNLSRSRYPAYHIHLSTRDMARIGLLMLNEGNWNGRQILSPEWARRITSVVTPLEEMNPVSRRDGYLGYGAMWWVLDGPRATGPFEGAYWGRGAIGQWIAVFPAIDLVVAHKTDSANGREGYWDDWHRILELIMEAKGQEVAVYPWAGGGDR